MSVVLSSVRSVVTVANTISPTFAAELVFPLFMRVGRRLPVRPEHVPLHQSARRSTLIVHGKRVVSYEWGSGAKTALLVHGWRGRASQFAPLVRELRAEGFRVVAFDAPANGDSGGHGTYILEYIDAMRQLEDKYGPLDAVVAHSFGVLATVAAANEGLNVRRVVGIAGVAEADHLVQKFSGALRLTPEATAALRARFQRRVFPNQPDLFDRFSGVRNPLSADIPLLLLHDRGDRTVDVEQSQRLAGAHDGSARLIETEGLGHTRILSADQTLDAVIDFVTAADRVAAPSA